MTTPQPVAGSNRPRRRIHAAATLAVIGLTLAFTAPAAAVTRTPYNVNLVKNPSFEAGVATGGYRWVAVPNWLTYGNMTVVKYGAPNGFPSLAEGARISGGKKFFTMGTPPGGSTACQAVAVQSIPLRGRSYAIDAGFIELEFRAYLGTYDAQTDTAVVIVRFEKYDYPNSEVIYSKTNTDSWMMRVGGTTRIPFRTRSITIYLASRNTQGYCDAYFDRISLVINPV